MITLDLVNPDKSDIKYKVSKFPDGQQDVTVQKVPLWNSDSKFQIKSRLNNFGDLELILCATKALRNIGVEEIHLFTPYILGARSDRQFAEGGTSYLRDIVAPILNAQEYKTVTCIDPHSNVCEAVIQRLQKINNNELVRFAFNTISDNDAQFINGGCVVVSPDAGALNKIYNTLESLEYIGDLVTAMKHRDIKTGKILSVDAPLGTQHIGKEFIIIDDICDGGRTFIEIAKVIREFYNHSVIYLVVTHGIFSAGMGELSQYFETIFTTNSYVDHMRYGSFLKQLNVF